MSAAALAAAAAMTMPMPVAPSTAVDIAGRAYSPSHLQVLVGDTVTWTNHDVTPHSVVATGDGFASPRLGQHEDYAFTFTEPGDHPYYCTLHPSMRGMVHVDAMALLGPARTLRPGATARLSVVAPAGTGDVTLHEVAAGREEPVATQPAGPDGRASFDVAVDGPVTLRARAGELTSKPFRVRVAPRITTEVVRKGAWVQVQATLDPPVPGATLALERYVPLRFAFSALRTARAGRDGRVAFTVRAPAREVLRVSMRKAPGAWTPAASARTVVARARR